MNSTRRWAAIIRENPRMGLYFIADPDGQWIKIDPRAIGIHLEAPCI